MTDPITAWQGKRVLVLGDAINDVFVALASTRKSPEADCEVGLLTSKRIECAGGAANVAANIESLGGLARLVCGRAPYSTKTRYVHERRHIVRLDDDVIMGKDRAPHILTEFETNLPWADIVVISDYAKGVLCDEVLIPAIKAAKSAGKTVIVDPKRKDWSAYSGADVFTPNRIELAESVTLHIPPSDIVMTDGANGMETPTGKIPSIVIENPDVCGAGDTVIAALALGIISGLTVHEAAKIANVAASIAVSKFGTATVTADELRVKRAMVDPWTVDREKLGREFTAAELGNFS